MRWILLIIFLAVALRLFLLDQFPAGFSGDEAQQGYSAYSILKTGKDEWGESFPLFPRGFGDYKPPLYTYLTIPSIAIFGLNEFAVRFPAAVIGILAVAATYFLAKVWFKDIKIAIFAAFFMAISPWHIQLSRTAFEGGAGILFSILGFICYLKGLKNEKYFYLSALFYGIGFYSYHPYKLFIPLFVLICLILDRKKLKVYQILFFSLIMLFIIFPIILNYNKSSARFNDVTIFQESRSEELVVRKYGSPNVLGRVVDNKYYFILEKFVNNYLSYYSLQFFFTGERPDNSYLNFPFTPLVYLVEAFFIIFFFIFAARKFNNNLNYIFIWLLIAPVPAAASVGEASANRAVTFIPMLSIVSAVGLVYFLKISKKLKFKKYLYSGVGLSLFISFVIFLYSYFFHLPYQQVSSIRKEYKPIFSKLLMLENGYNEIIVTKSFTEPQIFVAFYKKVDPLKFQAASKDWLRYEKEGMKFVDQLGTYSLGKYTFKNFSWQDEKNKNGVLYVGSVSDFPEKLTSVFAVTNIYKQPLFMIVDPKTTIKLPD